MGKAEAIARLQVFEPALRAMGATSLHVFGSTVRDERSAQSDVDLFLDVEPESHFALLDLAAAQRLLKDGMGAPIDLTTRDNFHPRLRDAIILEAEQVF